MTTLKIALAQLRCEKGALSENFDAMAATYAEAVKHGVDVVGFPEMNLTGYIEPARRPHAVLSLDHPVVAQAVEMTAGCPAAALFGIVEVNPDGKPFITQIVARDGERLGYYRKVTIKDEEAEWFSPGHGVPVFDHAGVTYGIAICADVHNRAVYMEAARQGARLVFELAAPGLYGDQETRDWTSGYAWWAGVCREHLSSYARDFGLWIAVATQAGRTVNEDFPGGAYLFAPDGERVFATSDGRPGVVYLSVDLDARRVEGL